MMDQPDYIYFECQDCGFDSVQKSTFSGSYYCPLCASDNGRDVRMSKRVCRDSDRPEGFDARIRSTDAKFAALRAALG